MIKKILKILLIGLGLFVLVGILFTFSGPGLPEGANTIMNEVIAEGPPELITGETGFARSGDVEIWYEAKSGVDTPKASILLIMGIANTSIAWPKHFIQPLVDSGYQVILYDHRGLGMSDWIENWSPENAYKLADMAKDGIAVLDHLGVNKAHIIGVSMGGMIAQRLVIDHPDRILSLISMMSSGYIEDPDLSGIPPETIKELLRVALRYSFSSSEKNMIKMHLISRGLLKGDSPYALDTKEIAQQVLYEIQKRKGYNPNVNAQHVAAVSADGSRYEELPQINVPTLVIHGRSDPLIPFEHAVKYAPLIPNAKTLWITGMGHDIPVRFMEEVHSEIFKTFQKGEGKNRTEIK